MTVLTKSIAGKKLTPSAPVRDSEHGDETVLVTDPQDDQSPPPPRNRRLSSIILVLCAMIVLGLGIMTGVSIYSSYARQRLHRFHGYCGVPYDARMIDNQDMIHINDIFRSENWDNQPDVLSEFFFKEEIEMDLSDDQTYTKITVPDFRDGRSGRFLHEFKYNQSLIMDKDNKRCFIMELDRKTILQPQSMYDLMSKMWSGYYNIDTDVVRKNMRIVMPAVTDQSDIAPRIQSECEGMEMYRLEKLVSGVFKRSADLPNAAKFAEWCGNNIVEMNMVNYFEMLNEEEKKLRK